MKSMSKIAVVTGTSSGIGEAVARLLLENEWEMIGISRRPVEFARDGYRHFSVDLSDGESAQSFFEGDFLRQVRLADYARVGLVNNSGTLGEVGPQEGHSMEAVVRAYTLNAVLPAWLMGFFLRHSGQARLTIVNISSGAADRARAGWSTYCSSKAALKMAGMVTAEDIANNPAYESRRGKVAIVSYGPGVVATAMQEEVRGSTPGRFPSVQRFIDFHAKGELKSSELPAREIRALLERDDLPVHSIINFGG
jgi:benzil reductase ((S)-benzoin forming)